MFVANVTPVMLIAGIGTLIQLYPVWRIGSRLPVVMGLSFTFLSAMMTLASKDYGLMIGAWQNLLVAGVFVVAMILSLALPKHVKMEDVGALTEDTIENKKPE